MSTNAVVHFQNEGESPVAHIYVHWDGYPDTEYGILNRLNQFFDDVRSQTKDTRFNDPSYLAAKFVVWLSGKNNEKFSTNPLDFLGIGIVTDEWFRHYDYWVTCDNSYSSHGDANNVPSVRWEENED